jgi:hypothetical protein
MPSELHEQLAQAADHDHVSLNRYVTEALSSSVEADSASGRPGTRALRVAVVTNVAIVVVAGVVAVVLLVLAVQRGI